MNQHIEHDEELVSLYPTHPGTLLKEEVLPDRNVSGVALAKAIGASRPDVTNMLNGNKAVTPWLAVRIEAAIGFPAELLLRMQERHDLAAIRREKAEQLAAIPRIAA